MCVCETLFLQGHRIKECKGAIPLVIRGWPTKRPMTRAENVPALRFENQIAEQMKRLKKFEEMQQDERVSMNRLEAAETSLLAHCMTSVILRVIPSVHFGWISVVVPGVRLQLYEESSVASSMSATDSPKYSPT